MESNTIYTILGVILITGILIYYLFIQPQKSTAKSPSPGINSSNQLQLQAYERLTLLVDRIALPNLISRTAGEGLSSKEMQQLLCKSIKDEFDYNVTQQIYVSPEVWHAVKNLKEKNILTINQIGELLPGDASSFDLKKSILNYLMNEPKANLHELVSEALSFEAKKHL